MTRGINANSVFTRTDPATGEQVIPTEAADDQDGWDIRTRRHWGVKIQNETDQSVSYRVLGFTAEDKALEHAIELATGSVANGADPAYESGASPGIALLQVEINPAAAATGDVTVVFGSSPDGR